MIALAAALGVAGCAAPRTAAADAAIHKVVIVTVLDESGPIDRTGLTVFNNASTSIPQAGALSRTTVDEITRELHRTRPNWEVVPAGVDLVTLGEKYKSGVGTFTEANGKIQGDLDAIVQHAGADAVFLVTDATFENSAGRGVGVDLRKLPGIDAHVIVRAHVFVELFDKAGERLAGASGAQTPLLKASDFGLTGDIESADSPEARARLSGAMHAELVRDLDIALRGMGY